MYHVLLKVSSLTEVQFRIRHRLAHNLFLHELSAFPEETKPLYQNHPVSGFYLDKKDRPVRVFGVLPGKQSLHAITLRPNGKTIFTIGGVASDELTRVPDWGDRHATIGRSAHRGVFLDPLGSQVAVAMAEESHYGLAVHATCTCCADTKIEIPTELPVMFNQQLYEKVNRECDVCGKRGSCSTVPGVGA